MHYPVAIALNIVASLVSSTTQASVNGGVDEASGAQVKLSAECEVDQVDCGDFCCSSGYR